MADHFLFTCNVRFVSLDFTGHIPGWLSESRAMPTISFLLPIALE
jgi:hypothetical protein